MLIFRLKVQCAVVIHLESEGEVQHRGGRVDGLVLPVKESINVP